MTRKQLEDAARCCSRPLSCNNCELGDLSEGSCYCIELVAQAALVYKDMLKRLEWLNVVISEPATVTRRCPVCGGEKPDHELGCKLAALLKEVEV